MSDAHQSTAIPVTRRSLLVGLGAAGGLVATGAWPFGPSAASIEGDFRTVLARFEATLSDGQRRHLYRPWDHPVRQLTNTIALFETPHMGTLLDARQYVLAEALYTRMLSARGVADFANTVGLEGRLPGCALTLFGDPASGARQAMIHGGHILLRGGGATPEGGALGGAIAYGQQIGNGRFKIEGNAFAYHGDAANALYAALDPALQSAAWVPRPPHELTVQAQGNDGRFAGAALAQASDGALERARELLEACLGEYPEADRREAWSCIEANGGVEALHIAYYESKGFYADGAVFASLDPAERAARPPPYWQVWRIEGPGTVIHFKGHPHLHAYVNIVRDPARQNVGATLGETDVLLEGEALAPLVEACLRAETGEALAFQHPDHLAARFCPGPVTTGLAWSLDPYEDRVVVVEIQGQQASRALARAIERQQGAFSATTRYRVATTGYHAGSAEVLGEPERVETGGRTLRDSVTDYLRREGMAWRATA